MIGAFRHVVELLLPAETPDEAGGAGVSFAPAAAFWAAVRLASAPSPDGGVRRRIRVHTRWRSDFSFDARLRFVDADYAIVSIESDDEKGARVFVTGEEVA